MKLELTKRDIKLIELAVCVLIVFLMARFLILPGIEQYQKHREENDRLQEEQQKIEQAIEEIPLLEQAVPQHLQELERLSEPYYARMENRQVDEVLTGLAIQCGLFPVSLSITEAVPMVPQPYQKSAEEEGASDESGQQGTEGNIREAEEEINQAAAEDQNAADSHGETGDDAKQTPYLLAGEATFLLRGSETQVLQFLDQIEKNYPSIQIRAMHRDQRVYLNEALEVVEEPDVSLTMAIYMCDWDAVTQRESDDP